MNIPIMMMIKTFPVINFEINFSFIHSFIWIYIIIFNYPIIYIVTCDIIVVISYQIIVVIRYGIIVVISCGICIIFDMFGPIMIMNIIKYLFNSLLIFKITIPINILLEKIFFLIR